MPSILVKDALWRVSAQLQDTAPQFTRWSQRELVDWLNDAQRAVAKYIPSSCARVDAIKLSPGTKQSIGHILAANILPGDGSAAANVEGTHFQTLVRNMGANGATPGRAIRPVDREMLDLTSPTWHTDTGTSVSGFVFDPRFPKVFYVTPGVPPGTPVWVEGSFLASPPDISPTGSYLVTDNDATTISIDDKYLDDLVNYVLARAFMKDSDFASENQTAATHAQAFVSSINAQATALSGVNPNLRALPLNSNLPKAAAPGG